MEEVPHENKDSEKKNLIRQYLSEIADKARRHQRIYGRYLRINEILDVIIAILNFTVVSAIFVGGVFGKRPGLVLASGIISTFCGILMAIQRSFNFRDKYQLHHVAAKQYSDLYRRKGFV